MVWHLMISWMCSSCHSFCLQDMMQSSNHREWCKLEREWYWIYCSCTPRMFLVTVVLLCWQTCCYCQGQLPGLRDQLQNTHMNIIYNKLGIYLSTGLAEVAPASKQFSEPRTSLRNIGWVFKIIPNPASYPGGILGFKPMFACRFIAFSNNHWVGYFSKIYFGIT